MNPTKAEFEKLATGSRRTEAALAIADALEGPLVDAFKVILQEIAKRQKEAGSISPNDQRMRDAIQIDLIWAARKAGLL